MTYQQAVAAIAELEKKGWQLGLDRMDRFLVAAGLSGMTEGQHPKFIHIAGTNGKGSTTAYVQQILIEHGLSTGGFFSPFVYDIRERVQAAGKLIGKEDFARLTAGLFEVAGTMEEGPTEFEFKTGLGFAYWKDQDVDWVALEVGLGGRFDSTNVVTPAASAIVSIGYDHMHILGDTLAKIAFEKAGVIKPGLPVIVGQMPAEASEVILRVAKERGAEAWSMDRELMLMSNGESYTLLGPGFEIDGLVSGIQGACQPHNMAVAVASVVAGFRTAGQTLDPEAVRRGVAKATAPGRFERRMIDGIEWILDGAHNEDAAASLAKSLEQAGVERGSVQLITNMLLGHEPADFYRHLAPYVRAAHIAPIDFPRARSVDETANTVSRVLPRIIAHVSLDEAIRAVQDSVEPGQTVLVTGSFYLVGQVGNALTKAGLES